MPVLVTGGAGYIGSHVARLLVDAGEQVTVLDDLSTGFAEAVPQGAELVVGSTCHDAALDDVLGRGRFDAVLHFAASLRVEESVADPLKYYANNVGGSVSLVRAMVRHGVGRLVFSSTAAVYGQPDGDGPVDEGAPTRPISPYGASKLMVERVLADTAVAHGLAYVALRYFNVAGADPSGANGQRTRDASHLVKVAVEAALGVRPRMSIFGTDWPTPDGTCVRDYIHVTDLASAHLVALRHLREGGGPVVLNCGYGRGASVREVIAAAKRVSGVDFEVVEGPRREGDPASLVADGRRIRQLLGWTPVHQDLDHIVRTAFDWERRLRGL